AFRLELDRDASDPLVRALGGRQPKPLQERPQHGLHLQHGKAHADAGAKASPERNPRVPPGRLLEESLRAESLGVGVEILAPMEDPCVERDSRTAGEVILAEPVGLERTPYDERERWAHAQRLLDDRVE